MRFLVTVLTLGVLLMPAVAQQNFRATVKKPANKGSAEPPTNCTAATHEHRFSDMRLAVVEITSEDTCGFNYINLEDNTTGPDNHFQYGEDFVVARAIDLKPGAQTIHSDVLPRKALHHGTRGIAVFCGACKAVMSFKVTSD